MISASAVYNKSSRVRAILFSLSDAGLAVMSPLEDGLTVSLSRVKFRDVARFVGLDHTRLLRDIGTFELHRSRIPTALFRSIVQDIDMMLVQYGPPTDHETEEATSRFLSPVRMNHLIFTL
jgi:hypothetical protein